MSEEYHNCFVCGKDNPIGLKLDFEYPHPNEARASLCLSELYEGYAQIAHGGILSSLLDEVMAKAVIHSGKVAFTAKLTISFRRPLAIGKEVQLRGWIESAKSRTIHTRAELMDLDGIYAEAEGIFVVPRNQS
nr:hypothetical protein [Candidatus Cloacimonadota bacterium]